MEQVDAFEFLIRFDKEQFAPLRMDEPPPLGHDAAPNAARILAPAIGNCLSASLVFCLRKANVTDAGLSADVEVEIVRTDPVTRGDPESPLRWTLKSTRKLASELLAQ